MNRILLVLVILNSFFAKAQTSTYHPFADSNAMWNIHYKGGLIICSNQTVAENYSYLYSGDSVINGVSYHELIIPFVYYFDTCQILHNASAGYKGGLRQDIAGRKVFFIPSGSSTEQLLYDFNLVSGDSVNTYQGNSVVSNVDSVLIGNNYRKRWKLINLWQPDIIEGIGSTAGPLEPLSSGFPDGPRWEVTCFSQSDSILYPTSSGGSCNIITNITDFYHEDKPMYITPNPFHLSTTLTIKLQNPASDFEVAIYDVLGKEILKEQLIGNSMEIKRGNFVNGVYFVWVRNAEMQWVEKIVVE